MVISSDSLFAEDSQIKHVVVDGYIFDYEVKPKKKASKEGDGSPAKVDGSWDYVTESPAGSSGGVFEIAKEGSEFKGSITLDDPSGSGKIKSDLKDISVNGSAMSFGFDVAAGGMNIKVTVSGEVDGESFDGTMSVDQFGSFPFTATLNPTLIANK
jgi:hypothetical protein